MRVSPLAVLAIAAPTCLILRGPEGLFPYLALWVIALPIILWPLRAALLRELAGALFIFLTVARTDSLDDVLGLEQHVTLALVALSFLYLFLRRDEVKSLLRSPLIVWIGLFFAQQIANAFLLRSPELVPVWQGRTSVFAAVLAGAVLTRRPDGKKLFPLLLILGALVSVPVMAFEVTHPDFTLLSASSSGGRAGGMFGNPNEVGSVLAFAVACILGLRARDELPRSLAWWMGGACGLGILICGSRAAFFSVLLVLALHALGRASQRFERAPVATAGLALGVLVLVLPLVGQGLVFASRNLESLGFENTERLGEVVMAIAGSPDELEEDDSSRTDIATSAVQLIGERPLFGFGTGNFSVIDREGRHSHMQFLEVAGENGVIGFLLYAVVWIALVKWTWRLDPQYRLSGLLLAGAWLVAHFASSNVIVYRYYVLPIAYLCGLPRLQPGSECPDPRHASV